MSSSTKINSKTRYYAAIDLKSYYASVECSERGLNPLTTNLVVADRSRTDKTICLAVSPSLKAYGIPGRPRLFEVVQRVNEINKPRIRAWNEKMGEDPAQQPSSTDAVALAQDPALLVDYIVAPPRMRYYIEYSTIIYDIYLQYVAPDDIFAYSIDEVFIDLTSYLNIYGCSARDLAMRMIRDVLRQTGITATCGIGTNMYLAKIAMDIVAKRMDADEDGVRIAELDEMSYRRELWTHKPMRDFWRIGRGSERRLAKAGMHTMGDVARCSVGKPGDYYNPELLYRLFGVNAELLIDHAWGWEPCTIADAKNYEPEKRSLSSSQVLSKPYPYDKGKLIVREMAELVALDLVSKNAVAQLVTLTVGYDIENLTDPQRRARYKGKIHKDYYGRLVPEHAHGTVSFSEPTSSSKEIVEAVISIYESAVDPALLIRRVVITAEDLTGRTASADKSRPQTAKEESGGFEQLDLFTDYEAREKERKEREENAAREHSMQKAILDIQRRFGKNAVLKGMNLEEDAMTIERNSQIGGHRAGAGSEAENGRKANGIDK